MSRIRENDIFTSLQEVVELINRISNEGSIEYIESILYYVIERADSEKVEGILSEFKKAVTPEHSERLMTIAERLKEQGKEIGIQIGIEKGKKEGVKKVAINMLLRKLDEKIISESTGLTIEEIQKLKQN